MLLPCCDFMYFQKGVELLLLRLSCSMLLIYIHLARLNAFRVSCLCALNLAHRFGALHHLAVYVIQPLFLSTHPSECGVHPWKVECTRQGVTRFVHDFGPHCVTRIWCFYMFHSDDLVAIITHPPFLSCLSLYPPYNSIKSTVAPSFVSLISTHWGRCTRLCSQVEPVCRIHCLHW